MDNNQKHGKIRMNEETAMGFAFEEFARLHPKENRPDWINRCTVVNWTKDTKGQFIISLSVTLKKTNRVVTWYEAVVNPETAETLVLIDDFSKYSGEELKGF